MKLDHTELASIMKLINHVVTHIH